MSQARYRTDVEKRKIRRALELDRSRIPFLFGKLFKIDCPWDHYRHPGEHVRPRIKSFRHEDKLQSQQHSELDCREPLDPVGADEVYKAANDGSYQQTSVDGQNPESKLLAALILKV